jgi:hypothetical protein
LQIGVVGKMIVFAASVRAIIIVVVVVVVYINGTPA